jgi:hypothetical protein
VSEQKHAPLLLPDAEPLITLAYAGRLDLLLRPGWPLRMVDMVLHEVTRNATPSRDAINAFVAQHQPPMIETATFRHYQARMAAASADPETQAPRKAGLGELAMQEAINQLALLEPPQPTVLLFEDHKIARTTFLLPEGTLRVSTRAFLIFLEEKGWLPSAAEVEQQAISAGRSFSRLRFP